jgi:tRNA A-37 threonylcarbamoyl transferase component Bud32
MSDNLAKEIFLIRRKKKRNIIHEIYLYDQILIKRFIKTAAWPDMRQVWMIEDNALRRLKGLQVPKTYGFVEKKYNGAKEIIYAREYLDGKPVEQFEIDDMDSMARLMVQIHHRGVVTRDPSRENFIKTADGKILFIDFGRSIILNPKNPLIVDYQGKELARIRHHALAGNDVLYTRFRDKYFESLSCSPARRFLMEKISFRWYQFLMG